jgi:FAD/FMN-containing dehydrogenase
LWGDCYDRVVDAQLAQMQRPIPLPQGHGFYVIIEGMGADAETDDAQFERALTAQLEAGTIVDAVIATSESQRTTLWGVREDMYVGFTNLIPFSTYDVSMAQPDMPGYVAKVKADVAGAYPGGLAYFYGHAGDGNLHIIINSSAPGAPDGKAIDTIVFDAVRDLGGSISAEHGVGTSRKPFLGWSRSEDELWLMRTMKQALDPKQILNPGKVL